MCCRYWTRVGALFSYARAQNDRRDFEIRQTFGESQWRGAQEGTRGEREEMFHVVRAFLFAVFGSKVTHVVYVPRRVFPSGIIWRGFLSSVVLGKDYLGHTV